MTDPRIGHTTKQILKWLVSRDYMRIEAYTRATRLSAIDIEKAVSDYGRNLLMPPKSALQNIDVIEVKNSNPNAWSVRCDLWTEEEGRSDLTLEMTLIEQQGDMLAVEMDGLHVL